MKIRPDVLGRMDGSMFSMVSSKFLAVCNIMLYSVILNQLKMLSNSVGKEKLHSYFFSYIIRQHISKTA